MKRPFTGTASRVAAALLIFGFVLPSPIPAKSNESLDSCLVGSWVSRAIEAGTVVRVSGLSGMTMTIKKSGLTTVALTGSTPYVSRLNGRIARTQRLTGTQMFTIVATQPYHEPPFDMLANIGKAVEAFAYTCNSATLTMDVGVSPASTWLSGNDVIWDRVLPLAYRKVVSGISSVVHFTPCPARRTRDGVPLYGPGDVISLDPHHVVRAKPSNFENNVPSDTIVEVDFDQVELPWLYSPCPPTPWITLAVLKTNEFEPAVSQGGPLPAITVLSAASLPDLLAIPSQTGVRVPTLGLDQPGPPSPAVIQQAMVSPASAFSYIRSARVLEPDTSYVAFVVPAFLAGAQAGVGTTETQSTTSAPAWAATASNVLLPFYYTFQFKTGSGAPRFRKRHSVVIPRVRRPVPVPAPTATP